MLHQTWPLCIYELAVRDLCTVLICCCTSGINVRFHVHLHSSWGAQPFSSFYGANQAGCSKAAVLFTAILKLCEVSKAD